MSFVCQRILWFRYWKVSSCAVCLSEVLVSKGFFRSCFLVFVGLQFVLVSSGSQRLSEFGCQVLFFLVFADLQFVSESFFRFSMFVRVWVSEHCFGFFCKVYQRFQGLICHRISLGLVFQFEVWVS